MNEDRSRGCFVHEGGGAHLLIAPHGGVSRSDLLARPLRGNDHHTADLACALGKRLDASLLVNARIDRNALDLNRVADVTSRAAWYLDRIEQLLDRILTRHARAEVYFIHGWHVTQPLCDVGIGATLEDARDAQAHEHRLTVRPSFVLERLEPLRERLARLGVQATYGERWPAAHRTNVMQLFRRPGGVRDGRWSKLGRWVDEGRIEAVQLELGAPLRWPGRLREGCIRAMSLALKSRRTSAPEPATLLCAAPAARPAGLPAALRTQAFDPAAGPFGLGVSLGIGRIARGALGASLLLFPGRGRMALFTGHGRDLGRLALPGLVVDGDVGGFSVRFSGSFLVAESGARYFRSEPAQGRASLVSGAVRLVYERSGAGELGRVKGRIALDGETFRVDAGAFVETLERGSLRRPVDRILACFGRHLALKAEMAWDSQEVRAARLTPDGAEDVGPARLVQGARGALRLELAGAPPLRCRSSTKVTLLRPAGGHGHRRVTLSTAHFRWGAATPGAGFLERSRPAEIL